MEKMLLQATRRILKPLVRILYRKGVAFGEFSQLARQMYVEVTGEMLTSEGERPTTSRIAISTGLTRKDVAQLRQMPDDCLPTNSYNRGTRVMTGWLHDREFHDAAGEPALLPVQGEVGSFASLVSRYSGDMPYRAMLHEMERLGAVQVTASGHVQLMGGGYIPHANEAEKFSILGTDVAALIATIEHNLITQDRQQLRFQRKVSYDNLPIEVLPAFKAMVDKDGLDLLIKFNGWLAIQDRDSNPQVEGTGRMRAGVGIYYFEEPVLDQQKGKDNSNEN